MLGQEWDYRSVLKSALFQQTAPFVVLFVLPALVVLVFNSLRHIRLASRFHALLRLLAMGLDSLGFSWLWGSSSATTPSSSRSKRHRRKSSGAAGKTARTRAEQIALNKLAHSDSEVDDAQYYPGLVNISGTYCFMNSTLQAMASLTYLHPHIDAIHAKAEMLDVPTPVIDALRDLFRSLNTPKSTYHSLRPIGIINALSAPPPPPPNSTGPPPTMSSSLFTSREHQDAQELFQLVSEFIKNEMAAVDREGLRDRGIAGLLDLSSSSSSSASKTKGKAPKQDDTGTDAELFRLNSKSVFDGLTANRRSCVMCGYTEAVMHFGFDNWQLAIPRLATSCRLEDCLEDYTRLEILKDCICRKCSILATHKRLLAELNTLQEALNPTPASPSTPSNNPSNNASPFSQDSALASSSTMPSSSSPSPSKPSAKPSQSKKKRLKEVKKMEQRVRTAIDEGRIEDEALLEGVRLERVVSPASTKQAMIARPPPVLALHLNRSVHYGHYASKNTSRVHFPEVLDLTPFTTSGSLSTVATSSISTPEPVESGLEGAPPLFYHSAPSKSASASASPASSKPDKPSTTGPKRPTTPTRDTYAPGTQRVIYRLAAVVCHYGNHSFGHYICYRRKPVKMGGFGSSGSGGGRGGGSPLDASLYGGFGGIAGLGGLGGSGGANGGIRVVGGAGSGMGTRGYIPPTLVDPLVVEEEWEEEAEWSEGIERAKRNARGGVEMDEGEEGDVETDGGGGSVPPTTAADREATIRQRKPTTRTTDAFGTRTQTQTQPSSYSSSSTISTSTSRSNSTFSASSSTHHPYYWEDRSESLLGTNKGWLRISDDAVEECGIERVLGEGSGVFMLYYEKAVHPRAGVYLSSRGRRGKSGKETPRGASRVGSNGQANGFGVGVSPLVNGYVNVNGHGHGRASRSRTRSRSRTKRGKGDADNYTTTTTTESETETETETELETDADGFSIGSEETLRPETKVMNLNGSIGSLVSEVGVGVKKTKGERKDRKAGDADRHGEKDRDREREREMSMSLPASSSGTAALRGYKPRIIRNVSVRRRVDSSSATSSPSSSFISTSPPSQASSSATTKTNGSALHPLVQDEDEEGEIPEMVASAPSILASPALTNGTQMQSQSQGLGSKSTKVISSPKSSPSKAKHALNGSAMKVNGRPR